MIVNQANLQGIYKSFRTIFSEAWDTAAPSQWPLVAMEVPSEAREENYDWLGDLPMMKEWVGNRVIRDLSAFHYAIVNKDFEATIEVDRNDVEDDRIGIHRPRILQLADAARRHPDLLVFDLLGKGFSTTCYDGQYFFDTDHPSAGGSVSNFGGGSGTAWFLMDLSRPMKPIILQIRKRPELVALDDPGNENVFMRRKYRYGVDDRKNVGFGLWQLAYASRETLTAANYAVARAAMMGLKNEDGVPLGITPTHLVVPPTLESAGRSVLKVINDAAGAGNPWYGTAELAVVPWLA
ncbi:Mu-like prophage major head subunit gpT family protein [Syntrophobacter fumaroxidans]|uniref:Mu-like prophage major head subunit n=1 Tax=Syntrophobacter fumaroxidans (strain DSM 10017 / MPOB) TaxID=335543 RepID=A0LJG5_SYNFM|nr:Mu-like prophage major head subunit gpT family protein [Syntrophobacter fumaroxidans]ABK17567.1 Mu-like prophage major head subunit [Syntrophobacter fumaroxidans MPOB]HOI96339.1 Mu-like prophage major head subunit gpT family protein [Syntrophobacter fumaroxidans]